MKNKTMMLASSNAGKLIEMQALLAGTSFHLVTPKLMGIELDVEEDGLTYAENALKKARAYAAASGLLVIADDSGLEVDALDGQPGLHSARFSPIAGASDADRRAYLLTKLAGIARPWRAQFRCVIAVASPDGEVFTTEGICQGEILPEERGQQGFGYDPIFFLPDLGKTMAEMSMEEKNTLSHRARAVLAAIPRMERMGE
jgi:XTP/dITP diphosphohydrolase